MGKPPVSSSAAFHYLALGDSYTVGESVPNDQSFPAQLRDSLQETLDTEIGLEIMAVTGWRTDNLQNAVSNGTRRSTYDLVTLLIGVNNQFQHRPFGQYEKEFTELLEKAIALANGQPENVLVVSIPDYAFTPFGQQRDMEKISREIDAYNAYAASVAGSEGVSFVNITDITRKGLEDPSLVASDGLHPSGKAYHQFMERIFPLAFPLFN
ncbi:SGNH/GDSL hydrolase family protein [Sediminicola sp. 1XM1-17]|uniref:SGNH/GDSL hydrolase family protein n=1 Tax=Sediminicola sp. 1XM1-17 TaxID=3127702 RepID=UPI003078A0C2